MAFIGVNPRSHPGLDALKKSCIDLIGVPAPLPPLLASMPSDHDRAAVLEMLKSRLGVPRADRKAIMNDAIRELEVLGRSAFGTDQKPFMVQVDESLFTTFIPALMDASDLDAFHQNWKLPGLIPAKLEARRDGGYWSYGLVTPWGLI